MLVISAVENSICTDDYAFCHIHVVLSPKLFFFFLVRTLKQTLRGKIEAVIKETRNSKNMNTCQFVLFHLFLKKIKKLGGIVL